MIKLNPSTDIWQAHQLVEAARPSQNFGGRFTIIHLHIALGMIDLMADVHCAWTKPKRGWETHTIGDWVNTIRALQIGGRYVVAETSTSVCMNH
jgi:hypothetical protein